jgi:murein hydrolase activator
LWQRGGIIDWRPVTCASRPLLGILLLAATLALPAAQPSRKASEKQLSEKQLKQLKEQIEGLARQLAKDGVEKDQLSRDLRDAERRLSGAYGSLRELRDQRAARAAARRKLVEQRAAKEAERERNKADLARHLRAAYFAGSNEPLKLLLNQRNIGEVTRNLTYYGYFGRMRADLMADLERDLVEIKEITARIEEEDAELARLESQQQERVGDLDSAKQAKQAVLVQQDRRYKTRAAQLERMRRDKLELEQFIQKLSRATRSVPFDPDAPFARMRDKLSWPVAGRIEEDFGVVLGGADRFQTDWILIEAQQGAEVHAVHEGRVVVADWIPQRGNVIILDHGNDYLTLYGHNEKLFRSEGDQVKAGEVIATAGDSGGRSSAALWFQIRRKSEPVNPHLWLRSPRPPAN